MLEELREDLLEDFDALNAVKPDDHRDDLRLGEHGLKKRQFHFDGMFPAMGGGIELDPLRIDPGDLLGQIGVYLHKPKRGFVVSLRVDRDAIEGDVMARPDYNGRPDPISTFKLFERLGRDRP